MSPDTSLARARAAIEADLIDEAINIAQTRETRDTVNVGLHLDWARALEDLGLVEQAALELNLAIRDAPEREQTYQKLAEIYLDMGQASKAAKTLGRLVERYPDKPEFYELLAAALKEARQFDAALQVYQNALKVTDDHRFKTYIRDMSFIDSGEEHESSEQPSQTASIIPRKNNLITFCSLFSGREGVYARQWLSPTGESGYTPIQEPLNIKVAENHILGNFTVGAYPVRLDNTVNFMAFDFDIAKFALNKAITSEKLWSNLMRRVLALGCRVLDICSANQIPAYIEDSGFKGYHVWVFMESPIPAGVAKKCADLLVTGLTPLPQDITVEVFPKQTNVRTGGLGNLIKLPLGIHKRTGRRSVFISPDSGPLTDQLGFLETVEKASKRSIYGTIQRMSAPAAISTKTPTRPPAEDLPFDLDDQPQTQPQPRLPRDVQDSYDMDRDPEFQQLMLKCPVLRYIVDKANRTGAITKDETMALIHSVGHIKNGPDAVNAIFQRCSNADPTLFMKSQLKGNPVSCPKIRLRIPDITSVIPCNCTFDMTVNLYPTPLIHVRGLSGAEKITPLGITVDSLQFQNLVQDYIKLRKQLRETRMLLGKYETRLENFFDEAGVETVQTPIGELRMNRKPGEKAVFSLEI